MRVTALVLTVLASLAAWSLAFAHAEPNIVSPGDGAVLNSRPTQVVMEMTQDMARTSGANNIVVLNAAGTKVTTQDATIDNADRSKLSVPLPDDLPVGTYTVQWKTLSADDGDSANGSIHFTYDPSLPPKQGVTKLQPNIIDVTPTPTQPAKATAIATPGTGSGGSGGSGDGVTCGNRRSASTNPAGLV